MQATTNDCLRIDWERVSELMAAEGIANDAELTRRARAPHQSLFTRARQSPKASGAVIVGLMRALRVPADEFLIYPEDLR